MNRRFLTTVFIFACCFLFGSKSDACELPPIAEISNPYSQTVCVGCDVEFDGSTSYDQDEEGNSIEVYYWNYSEDSNWHEDGAEPNHAFYTAGYYGVYLYVEDDEEVMSETYDSCVVYVVDVNRVVKQGTTDEGPLYVCPDDTVSLEAKPNPAFASFPTGEPHWSIESQPPGANASLSPASGSATTTLSDLTEQGEYVIKAQCGDSDTGDTIIVRTGSTSGYWVNFVPYFACPRWFDPDCDLEWKDDVEDVCTNRITITCFPDECYYRYFFNGVEVGRCPWPDAHNQFWYKIDIYDIQFLETWHTSGNNENSSSGAGCDGYYCWRTERYDCLNTEPIGEGVWWERDTSPIFQFGKPWPGEYEACPGPTGGGPHPFWPD